MDDINVEFKDLVNKYVELDTDQKRKELIDEVKLMIVVFEKVCNDNGIKYNQLKSREVLDLKDGNTTENDYLEALFVYVQVLKELIGNFLNNIFEQ
jgi:hypothetical protein